MRIRLAELASGAEVLAGALAGRRLFTKLVGHLPTADVTAVCFLDFDGVSVATSSFLRESVVAFRDYCRTQRTRIYPMLVNLADEVHEELDFFLRRTNDAMLVCSLTKGGRSSGVRILGELDEKAQFAFEAVKELGETDAATLHEKFSKTESVTITAWNNRLSGLSSRGLLIEEQRGRSKIYRTLL